MSAEANRQVVLDYLDAVSRGDRDAALAAFHADATWKRPPSLGGTGIFEGRDAIFDVYFAADEELYETGTRSYDFEVTGTVAEANRVAVEMRHRGHTLDGRPYETDYHVLFELRDGRIAAVREYFDSLYIKRTLALR